MRFFSGDHNQTAVTPISIKTFLVTLAYCAYFGECALIGFVTKISNDGNIGNISFTDILLALKRAVFLGCTEPKF